MKNSITIMLAILVYAIPGEMISQTRKLEVHYNYSILGMNASTQNFELTATQSKAISVFKNKFERHPSMPADIDSPPDIVMVIFKDYQNNYLVSQEIISQKDFYTKESLNQMQWQLTGNSKTVLKYNCQEATTSFRGRDYVAYFTTEIPFKAAPFKFYGLPGVVLQIQTKDEQINIEATSLKVIPANDVLTDPFPNKKTIPWEEFMAIYKKRNKAENDKRKAELKGYSQQFLDRGMDKALDAQMNLTIAETRLEIIIPENDFFYAQKQLKKAFE